MKTILAVLLSVAAAVVMVWVATGPEPSGPRPAPNDGAALTWVATAEQLGVVGYRDPVGALSPDGSLLAYAEGRDIRVVPVGGGASRSMAPALGQVRHLAWADPGTLVAEDRSASVRWWSYAAASGERTPFWSPTTGVVATTGEARWEVELGQLRELAVSPDGAWVAGAVSTADGWQLWRIARDASSAEAISVDGRLSSPAFSPSGEVACVIRDVRYRLHLPCAGPPAVLSPDVDVVGPLAFSPGGDAVYFASPNGSGMVDLWTAELATGRARRLAQFSRDSYAPSVASDGTVLFRSQSYRTFVAEIDVVSRAHRQLALFQSETPSYHPDGGLVAVTYGTWRRQLDDVNYPDIAQHIGLIRAGDGSREATEPVEVIAQSESEDQAMDWSPNGQWIVLHSHREGSDDIWLRPRDGSSPDRRITFLGRGAEVGWPRWSPDGQIVLLDGASPTSDRSVMFLIGVDQESGTVTSELREIDVTGLEGEVTHGEWLPDGRTIVAVAKEAPGRHALLTVAATGGPADVFHRFATEHDFSGLAASPDGREVAFIALAPDGFFQVFRMDIRGGTPSQVTRDPSHKTQPAWSPDGASIAYTVWDYRSQFWTLEPGGD